MLQEVTPWVYLEVFFALEEIGTHPILDISTRWIMFTTEPTDLDYVGTCVMIYVEPNHPLHNDFWFRFTYLIQALHGPIVVFGDWNCLWSTTQKKGGCPIKLPEISHNLNIMTNVILLTLAIRVYLTLRQMVNNLHTKFQRELIRLQLLEIGELNS